MQLGKRYRYFLSHLIFSIFIACMVLALIFWVWYPEPLAKAVGVNQILFMLISIDIVIGPILSFVVYKEGKKTLVFDLSMIIILQLSALGYGLYNIAQGRPAWIVYYKDSYELIRHTDLISDARHISPWFGPKYVGVKLSSDPKIFSEELSLELAGYSLAQYPEKYIKVDLVKDDMKKYAQSMYLLNQYNDTSKVQDILKNYPNVKYFFPMKASFKDMTVLVDQNYNVIKIVDLRPWS